jgi:SAM-dependent methyltransferase
MEDDLGDCDARPAQSKQAEVAFFDAFARGSDYEVLSEPGYQRVLSVFDVCLKRHGLDQRNGVKGIDLGCGTGAVSWRVHVRWPGIELHGMDISPVSIERARASHPDIDFHVGDIEESGLESDSFDVAFLGGVLHHFPDPRRVIAECGRILRPGGILLAYDPHRRNPVMWAYRCKNSPFYSSAGVTENEEPVSKAQLRWAFGDRLFSEVSVAAISGVSFRYVQSRSARIFLPVYNLVDRFFDLPPLRNQVGSFLVTYARKSDGLAVAATNGERGAVRGTSLRS